MFDAIEKDIDAVTVSTPGRGKEQRGDARIETQANGFGQQREGRRAPFPRQRDPACMIHQQHAGLFLRIPQRTGIDGVEPGVNHTGRRAMETGGLLDLRPAESLSLVLTADCLQDGVKAAGPRPKRPDLSGDFQGAAQVLVCKTDSPRTAEQDPFEILGCHCPGETCFVEGALEADGNGCERDARIGCR